MKDKQRLKAIVIMAIELYAVALIARILYQLYT